MVCCKAGCMCRIKCNIFRRSLLHLRGYRRISSLFRFYRLLLCRPSYLFSEWIRGKDICESLRQKRESALSPSDITHTIASALLQEHEFKYRLVRPKLMLMTLIFFEDYNPCGLEIITLFCTDDFLFCETRVC